jgi:hypothetical protein
MALTDTSAEAASVQLEVYRRMSPTARLRVGLELTAMGRRLLADGVRRRHPEYSDEHVHLAFLRLWLGDELYRAAYPDQAELAP